MKKVSVLYLICILLGASSSANGQGVSKCFRADWLQGERTVNFTIDGSEVTGTFTVGSDGADQTGRKSTYKFSGKLSGNSLRVTFVGRKAPDVSPSEMKSLVWTIVRSGGKESLRIKFSGKNYQTNKYEVHFAYFESCGVEGHAAFMRSAKRVQFPAGATSVSFPVTFKIKHEGKPFLLNMREGQRIAVEAPGCGISFYYPDKREGEEPAIDNWSSDALTQSGDYLFVIRPAGEPGTCSVNFKVTDK